MPGLRPDDKKDKAGLPPSRTSHRLDPSIAKAARHSGAPEPDTYSPIPSRASPTNLSLSVVIVMLVALTLAIILLWVYFNVPELQIPQ